MESLTDDLWTMVLARLPIKIFTCFKLVCKQWKSILESPFFRNLFMSLHQNSVSCSWSIMGFSHIESEIVGHYQCDTWGLTRTLGYFVKSFVTYKLKYRPGQVSIRGYSDGGLILIRIASTVMKKLVLYVANPVSQECVEIVLIHLLRGFANSWEWGLVTRTEHGVLLGYKIILIDKLWENTKFSCLIYSSETGLWSLETLHLPYLSRSYFGYPISLNGNLHWIALNSDNHEVVLSMDVYATAITGSDRCRVTPFPDLGKTTKFKRVCYPCQGFLHYLNIVDPGSKLCLWRLQRQGWQLISEISPGFILTGLDYLPLMINSVDAKTAYFWSPKQERLVYFNLHNGRCVIHKQMEGTSNGQRNKFSPLNDPRARIYLKSPSDLEYFTKEAYPRPFILPQWLHPFPKNTVRVEQQPTTTTTKRGKETSLSQSKRPFTIQEKGKEKSAAKSQQKPNINQLSSQQRLQKDIPSKNRIHGKVVTEVRSDAIELSNPFESLDDLPE